MMALVPRASITHAPVVPHDLAAKGPAAIGCVACDQVGGVGGVHAGACTYDGNDAHKNCRRGINTRHLTSVDALEWMDSMRRAGCMS